MKKRFTFLIAALMLLVFMMPSMVGWGQSRVIKTYKLTIDNSVFNTTSYAANNNEKTSLAVNTSDNTDTYEVKWTSYQVMKGTGGNSAYMQWQKNAGKIYNTTNLGTITSVTVTSSTGTFTTCYGTSSQPSSGSQGPGKGYFQTSVGNATGYSTKVEVVFQIEEAGPTQLDTPANFSATAGNGQAEFTWDAITNASGYTISYTPAGGSELTITVTGGNTTSKTITGLTNSTTYTCKIKANGDNTNFIDSEYSSTITVTPTGATSHAINITSPLTGGSVTASAATAIEGTTITLTATPSAGYTFNNTANNWSISPSVTITPGANNTATFEMPASNVTVGATFTAMSVYSVSCTTPANGTLSVSPTSGYNGVEVTITATPNSGYELATLTATDTEGSITITDNKFSIRNSNVTVTATFARAAEWILTDISELTSEDVFVIVGTNSGSYSMSNNNGTTNPPAASSVTILEGKITSTVTDNIKWNISGNASDGYTFYPNGSTTTWLYCTNTNNGVRIGDNENKTFSLDKDNYLVHSGTKRILSKYSDQWRCYGNYDNTPLVVSFYKRTVPSSVATPTFSVAEGTYNENQSVTITCATEGATIRYTTDGLDPASSGATYNGPVSITQTTTLKAIAIKDEENSYVAIATYTMKCATPTFSVATGTYTSVQNVTITSTVGASIYYTLDGTTPTSSSSAYNGAISIDETKTLKAIAIKGNWENSDVASATYTIDLPLTTIQAIFDASSPSSTHYVTFNNWVVSGVRPGSPSNKAYVTDGEKGFAISNSNHGFTVGDVLSGTVQCSLSRSNGAAQITNITSSTDGLTVSSGGVISVANIAMADLSGVNTGALVSYNDLSYDGTNLSDGTTSIKPYSDLMSLSSLFPGEPEDHKYHVTGVYLQYNSTKEILPRTSADVVIAADLDITADLMPFSYIVEGPSDEQNIDVICTDLGSNILTATASSDYEISLAQDGTYTQSVEMTPEDGGVLASVYVRLRADLLVGEHNGTVTFTATNLTTATVNVTGLVTETQTYDVVLDDVVNGTISADPMLVEAGETVTLTATPDDCYQFVKWVTEPEVDWVSDNQFTMPAEPVLVSATFEQKTFVVTYSFNGEDISSTSPINCGETTNLLDEDDLETLEVEIPSGFLFQGWSEEEGSNTLLSSPYTPTATRTLYAVLTYGESEAYYARVTSDLGTNWAGDYLIAYSSTVFADGRVGGKDDAGAIGKANVKVNLFSYISGNNIPATNGDTYKVTLEKIENSNTYVLKTQDGKYNYQTTNSNGLVATTTKSTAANYPITVMFTSENDIKLCLGGSANGAVFRYNDGNGGTSDAFFRFYKDGGQNAVYLYKRTVSEVPNFNEVVNVANSQSMSENISESMCVIVENNGILTFSGENQGTAENLIIKDGGQLKVYVTDTKDGEVQATVEKNITHYTVIQNHDEYLTDGWYFIASPINSNALAPTNVTNMLSNTYDLYQLNNTSWENYKEHAGNANPGFNLANGRGYLYANSEDVTLSFAGAIKPFNKETPTANQVAVKTGWNLIGNPFTFNVYADVPYYAMNAEGTGITANTVATSTAIAPCTSIVIKAENASTVNFSETSPVLSTGDHGNLQMVLAHKVATRDGASVNKNIDNAIVSFNEGSQLEKFYFGNPSANIFIPQNGEDYAIAFSDRQGDVPLYFKANETGTYTISFAGDEMSLNGIYLIDILAEEEIDLSVNPSYTFIGSPADRMARFKIVFRNTGGDGTSDIFAYQNGNDIIVSGEGELQIFDVMGRMVSRQRVNGVETVNVKSQGVYIFRLNDKTQKIVVR